MAKMLMIHADKCTGCHNCELACSMAHEGSFRLPASRVHVYTWERESFSAPMMCQQCSDAPCVKVCTPHALARNAVTGLVNLDRAKCIGCKMCVQACPFGAMGWNPERGRVFKCDLCHGEPQCVRFCDMKAVDYVDVTRLQGCKMREAAENYSELMRRHGGK